MTGRTNVKFQFRDSQGKVTETLIDLTSNGNAGEAYESYLGEDVRSTEESSAKAINMMKESTSVEVNGLNFTMDDIGQVPCL